MFMFKWNWRRGVLVTISERLQSSRFASFSRHLTLILGNGERFLLMRLPAYTFEYQITLVSQLPLNTITVTKFLVVTMESTTELYGNILLQGWEPKLDLALIIKVTIYFTYLTNTTYMFPSITRLLDHPAELYFANDCQP